LRNQQASRYARWAAFAAGLVALIVLGIYVVRAITASRHHTVQTSVPASVKQQTQTFSYNGIEQNRTVFTIRASQATQFKANAPAVLEDVWITIYGREGERTDNIHTRECSYEQRTGGIQCKGEVTIDLDGNPGSSQSGHGSMHITTSNLTFDGQTGEASSPAPVQFTLPQGEGGGVGVAYSTRSAIVRVEHGVHFRANASERSAGAPVDVSAASVELRRKDRTATLTGPVEIDSGDRKLSAQKVSLALDANFRVTNVVAEGNPSVRMARGGDTTLASASRFDASLNAAGWIQQVDADGGVNASRRTPDADQRFSSDRARFTLEPSHNLLRELMATGNVAAESDQSGVLQTLKTASLRVDFGPGRQPDQRRITSAETLSPATIDTKNPDETTSIRAPKFTAQFNEDGHLAGLVGSTGIELRRRSGNSEPQASTADVLHASFTPDGQWATVEEKGHVQLRQGDRHASASYARIDRATDEIALTGSPVLSDSMTRTTAQRVTINQKTGQIDGEGDVASTYSSGGPGVTLGSGAAHIAADKLSGSTSSGRAVYSGHARLWQGESVLEADEIALWRDEKKLVASGRVVAVFPEQSAPALKTASETKKEGADLWRVRAPMLTYWNDRGQARLDGGVEAVSQQASIDSHVLDVYFGTGPGKEKPAPAQTGAGRLTYAVAQGNVVVRQQDFRATAERAEYSAAQGKFVLSGGHPTITDSSANTTSGRSLTFFIASDTISIDSQEGSRTLTKHRVEK
jgi:lipopolysaccharide export system protein LptA